jgi:hypothetical protein
MQLFYKITNEEKNEVQVYFGGRSDFAAENGFIPGDVEQCITSGKWYLKGKMPAEEKAADLRETRDFMLSSLDWRFDRYREQKILGIETTDSEQDFIDLLQYKQYLRDITKDPAFPDIQIKTFEEFNTNKG